MDSQKPFEETGFFPFCSQRCKLIDLGAWLDAEYKMNSGPDVRDTVRHPLREDSIGDISSDATDQKQ